MRRRGLLAALALTPGMARAQTTPFPARTVRIVVPYGPGGSSDIVARILAQHASEVSGQNFVVENRGGGATVPGTQAVATAAPDGYTLGTNDNALLVNPALIGDRLPYDTERDLGFLGLAVTSPALLLAHPAAPARSVAEVLAEATARPGLGISHGGIGAPTHLALVQFQMASGREITPVGYRGGGPQLAALAAGDTPYGFVALSSSLQHVQSGRLRALAVTGAARAPLLPEVPSMAEAGLPAVDVLGIWGFITPPGLPPAIMARLHALLLAPAREAPLKPKLEAQGYSVVAGGPEEYAAMVRREIAQWRDLVQRAGIKVE
ncbi:Bug family tripartite tricarboxylate transporter substrate binding protein [Paracraurococcus lichenis]|uniref:Tripartite tricarboxylate transporter substrate binding protein n=1 Tax=Paracraurococcus lichenis TaxID=3064888 RepID=A0ABT9DVM7_9PROT|nr:tripartite tricarboxylate transporter substrate binding protein [Paracraurococcus sp. LOR1-02]MDO9707956.1 tripartite tricarboxylate transporter substrate binding protein [Paracraurococcus sp. LOR1-02]